ncbi:MAG: glycoside hydrolase family 3 N-terminal domain-containing protein [Candidatus Obscuribacter sp.]|nr:glycoside hydrolase family 3 N-terminal domain-containing protein [Candidatus Obscuribacter sp.]
MAITRALKALFFVLVMTTLASCRAAQRAATPEQPDQNLDGLIIQGQTSSANTSQANSAIQVPTPQAQTRPTDQIALRVSEKLSTMTLRQKLGQLFMVGYTDTRDADELIRLYNAGNLVLMGHNDGPPETIRETLKHLQGRARSSNNDIGLLIAVDQEGGSVQRLRNGFPALPSAKEAALNRDLEAYARALSADLVALGVNMNLAPVLDIDYGLSQVIGTRAFGETAASVDTATSQYLKGARASGIVSTLKHFPGHGSTGTDSHRELPVVHKTLSELSEQDLAPFMNNIRRGLADSIMVGSIAFPNIDGSGLPASISRTMVQDVLRGQLGYKGVVLTDDAGMGALKRSYTDEEVVTLALNAGVDIVVCIRKEETTSCNPRQFAAMFNHLENAVKSGIVSQTTIDNAVTRVLTLKARQGLL